MKGDTEALALELLRHHPGWSDEHVRRELAKRKIPVATSSIQRWRTAAGLAPYTKNVDAYPPPRRPGVWLACGHLVHPEALDDRGRGRCSYCGS